jgi:hypothetical protein
MRSLIATMTILVSSSAFAQSEWIQYAVNSDGDNFYARAGSIHTVGGMKRVWTLVDLKRSAPDGDRSTIAVEEFDCRARRNRIIHATGYSGQMGAGVINGSEAGPAPWSYLAPGTIGERLLKLVCSQ